LYGHIQKLAEAEKEGLKKAGIEADLYQVPETLSQEVLTKVRLHTCVTEDPFISFRIAPPSLFL
jgi:multimeric flavodoxin WrbA